MKENYKLPIILIAIVVLLIIGGSVWYSLVADDLKNPSESDVTGTPALTGSAADALTQIPLAEAESFEGIITGIDPDSSVLTLRHIGSTDTPDYTYTAATDIRTSYGKPISALLLSIGDFVQVTATADKRLITVTGSKDMWSYKKAMTYDLNLELAKITIGETIYRYDESLLVLNDGFFVEPSSICSPDMISLYGVGDYVYLIRIVSGHGYLTLAGDSAFIGGTLKVGRTYYDITEDLCLTLGEGSYDIAADCDDLTGSATVLISRNSTSVFDLAPFSPEVVPIGEVTFSIAPDNAVLYVDGIYTDLSGACALTYGEHSIYVIADGYTPYSGTLNVDRAELTRSISLSPAGRQRPSEEALYTDTGELDELSDLYNEDDIADETDEDIDIPDSTSDEDSTDPVPYPVDNTPDTGLDEDNFADEPDDTATTPVSGEDDGMDEPDDASTAPVSGEDDSTGETGSTPVPSEDALEDEYIIIHCTEGASVFLNGTYKGEIFDGSLVTFKIPGAVEVRLTKQGYITKKYTITVEADGSDSEYSFPDLVLE